MTSWKVALLEFGKVGWEIFCCLNPMTNPATLQLDHRLDEDTCEPVFGGDDNSISSLLAFLFGLKEPIVHLNGHCIAALVIVPYSSVESYTVKLCVFWIGGDWIWPFPYFWSCGLASCLRSLISKSWPSRFPYTISIGESSMAPCKSVEASPWPWMIGQWQGHQCHFNLLNTQWCLMNLRDFRKH